MKRRYLIKSIIALLSTLFIVRKKTFAENIVIQKKPELNYSFYKKCATINDLRRYEPRSSVDIVIVDNYSLAIGFTEPGVFFYDSNDNTSLDNGGTCIVTTLGKRWKREINNSICVNWFGTIGNGNKLTIKDCIINGTFSSYSEVKSIFFRQNLELDDLWDNCAIQATFHACPSTVSVIFDQNEFYYINKGIKANSCLSINGNGATLIVDESALANIVVLDIGEKIVDHPISDVTLSKGSEFFPRNLISGDFKEGDLISFYSKTIRSGKQFENIRPYFHGVRVKAVKKLTDKIVIDRNIYTNLSLSRVTVHRGSELTCLKNINVDATRFCKSIPPLSGVRITGTNIVVNSVKIIGNRYCGAGLLLIGCSGHVFDSDISGFTNTQGLPAPGRVGYGIYVDCNDTLIENMTFKNNKHHVTCASRDFVMDGFILKNSMGFTDNSDKTFNVNAAFDVHSNVLGTPIFSNLDITTVGPAFNIRNGSAKIDNCKITSRRDDEKKPGLINFFDIENFGKFHFIDNTLTCGHNISLFHFGSIEHFSEIIVENNKGSIGCFIDQVMKVKKIGVLILSNNVINNLNSLLTFRGEHIDSTCITNEVSNLLLKENRFYCRSSGRPIISIVSKYEMKIDRLWIVNTLISSNFLNINFNNVNIETEFLIHNTKLLANNSKSKPYEKAKFDGVSFYNCNIPCVNISHSVLYKCHINLEFYSNDGKANKTCNINISNCTMGSFCLHVVEPSLYGVNIKSIHFKGNIFNSDDSPFISLSGLSKSTGLFNDLKVDIIDNVFNSSFTSSFKDPDNLLNTSFLLENNQFLK